MEPLDYKGYNEFYLDDSQFNELYSGNFNPETFGIVENEYIAIYNQEKELKDIKKYQNGELVSVKFNPIKNKIIGTVKPLNLEQKFALDLLQDDQITVKLIRGIYGSGKDYLMTAYAMDCLEKNKYDKMVFIRPNVSVAGVPDIGYLKGTMYEKLSWTLGPLYDKIGGEDGVTELVERGKLELIPLPFIRGRSFENSIIYVTEFQNSTKEIAKLLLGRVGEGSILMINADTHQVDNKIYKEDNGVLKMIEKLSGNKLFGYVYLSETLRSETSNLANLLDE